LEKKRDAPIGKGTAISHEKKKRYFSENYNKIDYNITCMKVVIVSTNFDSAIF